MHDARTLADCLINQHDGGASAEQLASALGWPAARVNATLIWLLERDFVSASLTDDAEWPFAYVRQNAKTDSVLRDA